MPQQNRTLAAVLSGYKSRLYRKILTVPDSAQSPTVSYRCPYQYAHPRLYLYYDSNYRPQMSLGPHCARHCTDTSGYVYTAITGCRTDIPELALTWSEATASWASARAVQAYLHPWVITWVASPTHTATASLLHQCPSELLSRDFSVDIPAARESPCPKEFTV